MNGPKRQRLGTTMVTVMMVLIAVFPLIISSTTSLATTSSTDVNQMTLSPSTCRQLPGILTDAIQPSQGADSLHIGDTTGYTDTLSSGAVTMCPSNSTSLVLEARNLNRRQTGSRFSPQQKVDLIKLHNMYRANVDPPAADMLFMEWNEEVAVLAQVWADYCQFKHGFPPSPLSDDLGQNLYLGSDKTGIVATTMWYEEKSYYDFQSSTCTPDKICGHYTQVVWARSKYLGCGIANCNVGRNLIVCNYHPAGNYEGQRPYEIGRGCSLCPEPQNGGLCFNNTCVTKSQCAQYRLDCKCPLKCHNCGTLDEKSCTCICKKGWDGLDCSLPCLNADEQCGANPGYRPFQCESDAVIRTSLCRKMCGQCTSQIQRSTDMCCSGNLCKQGYVLNNKCSCVPKCPGPACNTGSRVLKDVVILPVWICLLGYLTSI